MSGSAMAFPSKRGRTGNPAATAAARTRLSAFETAFRGRAPMLGIRSQQVGDDAFLDTLFVACSPLAGLLPPPMLEQQARLQRAAHLAAYPAAMRCVVLRDGETVGRIVIDWGGADSHCVDVAVLPTQRDSKAGGAMLRAWLDVVDAEGMTATLMVAPENPAAAIYAHLGFVPVSTNEPSSLHLTLRRLPALPA